MNVEVLEQSFASIKPHATQFVASFYSNLFTDYPQIQPLFVKTDMSQQQKHLMSAFVLIIDNLRQPDVLTDALKHLGTKHVNYGTIREHYPMVGTSLLKTFKSYMGTGWTPEVEQSWTDAYDAIASIMLEGAKDM
jgi:hemoglobin-like flavoprotein